MTDDTTSTTDASTRDADRDVDRDVDRDADRGRDRESGRAGRRGRDRGGWANADLYERLQWIALVVLVLVAVATLFQFYTNVSRFISIWASRKYEPAIQAAFALAVLASSLAGIAALSRNLR